MATSRVTKEESAQEQKDGDKRSHHKRIGQRVTSKVRAIRILRDANCPHDDTLPTKELIAMAEMIPIEKRFVIEIQPIDGKNSGYAFTEINGIPYYIKRGIEVIVKNRVVEALKNAVSFHYTQVKDLKTGHNRMIHHEKRAELFIVIRELQPDEKTELPLAGIK